MSAQQANSRVGLRRVDWVRLTRDHGQVRAEAVGIGFRVPVTCPIPLALAAELIASGTPHVTRTEDAHTPTHLATEAR
jgi:hypothetical protein